MDGGGEEKERKRKRCEWNKIEQARLTGARKLDKGVKAKERQCRGCFCLNPDPRGPGTPIMLPLGPADQG